MVWHSGQQLQGGKYTIERILGLGGSGITYLARQQNVRRDEEWVVIKTLKDELRLDPKWAKYQTRLQQDFLNEALKLARCSHPHVVQVKELIREETPEGAIDGMVMEYIRGKSLAEHLGRGILSEAEALRYIRQIGDALTVLHSMGLLHRDVKPQNIMLRTGTSEAVLIDFGLAREFMPDLTQTHTQSRTEGFAPLEQYDHRAKRGAYTDVYALAATLYCLLTGNVPRSAPNRSAGTPLESPKQYNPGISNYVDEAILKGMALRTGDRPQSMQEWLSLLEESIVRPIAPVRNLPQQSESPHPISQKPSSSEQNRTPIVQPVASSQNIPSQSVNSTPQRPLGAAQNRTPLTGRQSTTIPWIRLALVLAGHAAIGALFTAFSAPLWVVAVVVAMVGAVALALALALARDIALAGVDAGALVLVLAAVLAVAFAGAMTVFLAVRAVTFAVSEAVALAVVLVLAVVLAVVGAMAVARALAMAGAVAMALAGRVEAGAVVVAMAGAGAIALAMAAGGGAVAMAVTVTGAGAGAGEKLLESFSRSHTFLILAGTSLAGLGLGWLIGISLRSSYPQLFGLL